MLEAMLGEAPPLEEALARAAERPPDARRPRRAPARVHALADDDRRLAPAERHPGACEITVDCRLLPEQTPADVEPLIRAALGDGDYDLEFLEAVGGTRSPLDTPLWDALRRFTKGLEPGARLAPMACPGFTDSHYLRTAFGTTAYGYFPLRAMDPELATRLVHSANERIAVDDLELGVDMLRSVGSSPCSAA